MFELVRPVRSQTPIKVAVLDFDGTLSLIRAGWVEIMVDLMMDVLRPLPGSTESDADLVAHITDFVLNLNGRPTIYQMDVLVQEAKQRGGDPESAADYTQQFLHQLYAKATSRMDALAAGTITADDLLVPGARAMLTDLSERGVQMTIASGTAVTHVKHEAELLGIAHFFEGRIFGPGDDPRLYSKLHVMQQTLDEAGHNGTALLGFGDGFVETENIKQLGGIAIGCATDEHQRSGRVEDWKRTRLIQAGADVIIPDYRHWPSLAEELFAH